MIDSLEKIIAIFFSLLILANAICIRSVVKTWLFPACIFALFWFLMTFIPLIALFQVPAQPLAIAFIFFCTLAFSASTYLFNWGVAIKRNTLKIPLGDSYFNNRLLRYTFYTLQPIILLFIVLHSLDQGITFNDLRFDFYENSGKYAALRGSGDIHRYIYSNFILTLSYLSVSIGGLLIRPLKSNAGRLGVLFFSFLPSIVIMLSQSSKGAFFLSCAFFYGSILVSRIYDNKMEFTNKATNKIIVVTSLFIVPVIIVSFVSRGLSDQNLDYILWKLTSYLISYSFGFLYAFSDWFSFFIGGQSTLSYSNIEGSYGFYTFMAIFEVFGSDMVAPKGVYGNYFYYGTFLKTNIYSIYRGLILDFGIIGGLLHMYMIGFFFHLSYYALLCNRRPVFPVAVFVLMMGYIYHTYIISLFNEKSTYATFMLLIIVLFVNKKYFSTFTKSQKT